MFCEEGVFTADQSRRMILFLKELTDRLPNDAYLSTFRFRAGRVEIGGNLGTPALTLAPLGLNVWWIAGYAMRWAHGGPWPLQMAEFMLVGCGFFMLVQIEEREAGEVFDSSAQQSRKHSARHIRDVGRAARILIGELGDHEGDPVDDLNVPWPNGYFGDSFESRQRSYFAN